MSTPEIDYAHRQVDNRWTARVIISTDAFYGLGDTKEEAREDLIKEVEKAVSKMRAWVEEQP
jgi:hypothetical protein